MKSFGEWCEENNRYDYLDHWDYELNDISPYEISRWSKKKMAFKCDNPDHPSFYKRISSLTEYQYPLKCEACDSFGQYVIDTEGKDHLEAIWSDKNKKSYYEYPKRSKQKVWLRCLANKGHEDYEIMTNTYYTGSRCPYCGHMKICYDNSLEKIMPGIAKVWSEKNDFQPSECPQNSSIKYVWLKCEVNKHDDFRRSVEEIRAIGYGCPICAREKRFEDIDLTGQRFGRLQVIGRDESKNWDRSRYYCLCDCGNLISTYGQTLRNGNSTSCGCYARERNTGENNYNWKGGISNFNKIDRNSTETQHWRKEVLFRDNYQCQCCGATDNLEVHHILNFSDYQTLRFETKNGITLCKECHSLTIKGSFHSVYGSSNNTPEQLEEYINTKRKSIGINDYFSIENYISISEEIKDMAHERICHACEKLYHYCPNCKSYKSMPKWKALFDTETCKNVFDIVSGYNTGKIRTDVAKARLSGMNLDGITFKENIQAKIDEILAYEEPKKASVSGEQVSADAVVGETTVGEEPKPRRGRKPKKVAEAVEETPEESGEEKVEPEESGEEKVEEVAEEATEDVNNG